MGRFSRSAVRAVAMVGAVALVVPGIVAVGVAPAAAADPIIQLTKQGPGQILVGDTATYTLTATNPGGTDQVPQYNLSFRDVLPPGVVYVGPTTPASAGTPTVFTNRLVASDPASEYQTLVWPNAADLQVNSVAELSFIVRAARDPWPVSSSFPNVANAYTNADPRYVPKFDPNGVVVPGPTSFTASATASTVTTSVTAFRIQKSSSPTPEGELLRGIHDHVATYTLRVTNNPSFATNDIEIRDYLPAGLEFLGCGTVDNTPPSSLYPADPADPGTGLEYPGAGALTATALVDPCEVPVSVETVENPPADGGRTFPAGVYTKVTWRIGDFTPGQVKEIVYRAGIPQRANEGTWQGSVPAVTGGGTIATQPPQTANLDNNTGPSTRETAAEQALTNVAVGTGSYTGPVPGQPTPTTVNASTDHTVTAEDLAMQKSVTPRTFDSSGTGLATYTLQLQASEYVTAGGITITDVMPDGVCPVWRGQTPSVTGTLPPECGTSTTPAPGADPTNATLTKVTRNTNGTFTLVFAPLSLPANGTLTITYQGRMRTQYTSNDQPTSAGDTYTNTVSLTGETIARPGVNPPPNPGDLDDPITVNDTSSATQSSTQPVIDKRIKPNVPGAEGYQCAEGTTTTNPGGAAPGSLVSSAGAQEYVDPATAVPSLTPDQITFRNGSIVCFLLRVDFPSQSRTKNPVVTDFLPAGTSYLPNSAVVTDRSTIAAADVAFNEAQAAAGSPPSWQVGALSGASRFAPEGAVFEVVLAARIDGAAAGTTPDLIGNLMKFRSESTAGQAISLRDQLDLQIAPLPPVSLVKGIASITPAVPAGSPAQDVNLPPAAPTNVDGRTVRDGDVVRFRIDATNTSDPQLAAPYRSSVRALDVWDLLPAGVACASVTNPDPPDGAPVTFSCTDPGAPGYPASLAGTNRSLLRWAFDDSDAGAIDPGQRRTLAYDFTVPDNVSVATVLTDDAGVRSYQAFTNLPGQAATYYPTSNVDPGACGVTGRPACDAPKASDPSNVVVANVALAKTGTTSITEDANNTADQATIGETVTYTVTARVPYGTSVYQGVLTDTLPDGLAFVSAAADFSSNGGSTFGALPAVTTGPTNTLQAVTLGLPTSYTDAASATTDHVFRMTIVAKVTKDAGNTHGTVRTNTATFQSTASAAVGAPNVAAPPPATYAITVVEPAPALTKSANPGSNVVVGQSITYTLSAGNGAGRPPLHNSWVVDCVPAGLDFTGYLPAGRTDVLPAVPGDGTYGCATGQTRLAWQPTSGGAPTGSLLGGPANAATLQYTAEVSSTSAGLTAYTNTATLSGGTLRDAEPPSTPPFPPANPDERTYAVPASATITVQGGAVTKSVTPTAATIGQTATWTITATLPARVNFYQASVIDQVERGIDMASVQTISVTCAEAGVGPCSVAGTPLTPAAGPSGSTLIGWYLGDVAQSPNVRTITVTYSAKVANITAPALFPVRGTALLDTATGKWDTTDKPSSPTSADAVFERSSDPATATLTVREPLVDLTKTVSDASPDPGQEFTYTVRVSNSSAANVSTAYNVSVRDVVPAGVVVIQSSLGTGTLTGGDPTVGGGTITWPTIASIAPGGSITFTYRATLAPSASLTAAGKLNTASVTGHNSLADGSGRQYTGPSRNRTVTPQFPQITPTKTTPHGPLAYVGTPFTWQVTLTNSGAARAFGVDAVDTLPPNWQYTSMTSLVVAGSAVSPPPAPVLGTGPGGSQTLTWTDLGAINPGQTIVVTFTATPQPGAVTTPGSGAGIAHTNTVATTAEDATGAQSRCGAATQPTTPTPPCGPQVPFNGPPASADARIDRADLVLDKGHLGTPVAGATFDWTIDVRNAGPDTAIGPFTVTDTVASPMTFVSASGTGWTCSATGADVSCTRTNAADTLASGASFPRIALRVAIPGDTALPVTLTNSATVTGRTYESNTTNNTDSDSVALTARADLAIVKARSGPLEAGREVTYVLNVSNLGPSTSRATITVRDPIPSGTTFVSAAGPGWSCPPDGAAISEITCTRGTDVLAGTAAPQITVTLLVGSGFTGNLTNTATVSPGPTPDPNAGNNTSSVTDPVATNADVFIEKAHEGPFTPGTPTGNTYTFTVGNVGPADAAAPVRFTDELPEHLSWTGTRTDVSGSWSCTADPASAPTAPARQRITCTLAGGLAAGQSRTVSLGIAVATTAPADGEFVNTAIVTSGTPDPNPGNNTSTDRTEFDSLADLRISKTPTSQTVVAGTDVAWQLRVANDGPSNSVGPTTVTDVLPVGTSLATAAPGSGWGCTYDGPARTLTCVHPDGVVANGSLPPIALTARVAPGAGPATLVNVASVDGPTNDPTPENNTAEAQANVVDETDLGITKTFTGTNPVAAGAATTFSLLVTNYGPSDADNVTVADELPGGLTLERAGGDGWSCAIAGQLLSCTRAALRADADGPVAAPVIELEVRVDPAAQPGTIMNTAGVSSATKDTNPGNDTSSDRFDVITSADLLLSKSHEGEATAVAGQPFTFDLEVRNDGPSDAQAPIRIRDELPAGLSFLSAGDGWTCTTSGTAGVDQVADCVLDGDEALRAGTSAPTLALTVLIAADVDAGVLVNSAAVSSPTPDRNRENNTDTDEIAVTTLANLSIAKAHAGPVAIGAPVDFTIVVTNDGPSQARDVNVVDTLPAGLSFVSATGEGWTCSAAGQEVTCTLDGPVPPSTTSPPITLTVSVGPRAFPQAENVVVVKTTTPEMSTDDNRATDLVIVPPLVDLAIDKSHTGSFTVGQQGTYTVTVVNDGPTPDPGPQTITDTLPTGLSYVSAAGEGWACSAAAATVTCVRAAALGVGASSTVALVVAVGPAAAPSVLNTASVSTPSTETTTTNNTDSDLTPVTPVSVLTIAKDAVEVDDVVVTYRITVGNKGPSATSAPIVVSDPLPDGLELVSVGGDGWTCASGRTVTCTFAASLPVGSAAGFELVARLTADPGDEVVNVASIVGGSGTVVSDEASVISPDESDSGGSDGGLADTGADIAGRVALALLLLVIGAAAVQRSRRMA